jgi:hypothetical protein
MKRERARRREFVVHDDVQIIPSNGVDDARVSPPCERSCELLLLAANEIHERPQRGRHMPPARIIEKRPREPRPPALHDGLQSAAFEMRRHPFLEAVDEPGARDGRVDEEVCRAPEVGSERPGRVDFHDFAVAFELPGAQGAVREAAAQAGVIEELARVGRASAALEVGARCRERQALLALADGDRDHVFLEGLFATSAGVAARGEEWRQDAWKHEPCGDDGDVQSKRASGLVARALDDVERCADFGERGGEPFEEARAGLVVNLRIMFNALGPAEGSIAAQPASLVKLQREGKVRHIGLGGSALHAPQSVRHSRHVQLGEVRPVSRDMSLGDSTAFEWRAPFGAWRWLMLTALGLVVGNCGGEADAVGSGIPAIDFPCDGDAPLRGGLRCDGGIIHRETAGACASRWSTRESISSDDAESLGAVYGYGCQGDDQCTLTPYGHCVLDSTLPTCVYGCRTDDECDSSQLCLCSDSGGVCVVAQCHTDAECGPQNRCVAYEECGDTRFTCESPSDECRADSECPVGENCVGQVSPSGVSHRACQEAACVFVGRPFLIGGAQRSALRTQRSDWRSDFESAPAAPRPIAPELRSALACAWTQQALMEHASVAAFARFALQLLELGAPAQLVAGAASAMQDEVRHAQDCFALARRYADSDVGPGPLSLEGALEGSNATDVVLGTVREGCIGETLAALEAAEALQHCEDAAARPVLQRIVADETRHAELAWRFVAWALETARGTPRGTELMSLVQATFAAELATGAGCSIGEFDREMARHGVLSAPVRQALRVRALRDVVAPCAAALLESIAGGSVAQVWTTAANSSSRSPVSADPINGGYGECPSPS